MFPAINYVICFLDIRPGNRIQLYRKMKKRIGLIPLLLAVSLPAIAQLKPKVYTDDPINLKEFTLKNGLSVFLSENHDQPQVYGMVVVKAGGKNDPSDATGIAHYLEHMLFKGTTEMGTTDYEQERTLLDQISNLYEDLGAALDEEERKKRTAARNR